jgi:type II secretory pathway component GspD/PulD (secretin)
MRQLLVCLCWLMPAALIAAPNSGSGKGSGETTVEKTRKALQQTVTIEIADKTLEQAVNELKEKTKINFTLDRQAVIAIDPSIPQAQPFVPPVPPGGVPPGFGPGQGGTVTLKAKDMKIRDALKQILAGEDLTYVILGDSVLITTEAMAIQRQFKQHVSLDLDAVPFKQAVKQLARETGANLIVDSKLAKEIDVAVTLQVEDVPLETALRLLTEAAGLKPVRLGNVIYLTSKANAQELRSDPELSGTGQQMTPQPEYLRRLQESAIAR